MKIFQYALLVMFAVGFTACSSKPKKVEEPVVAEEEELIEKEAPKEDSKKITEADLNDSQPSVFLDDENLFSEPIANNQNYSVQQNAPVIVNELPMYSPAPSQSTTTIVQPAASTYQVLPQMSSTQVIEQSYYVDPVSEVVTLEAPASSREADFRIVDLDLDTPANESREGRVSSSFQNGYYSFSNDCNIRAQATPGSDIVGSVNKGKTLWVDSHSQEWVKVYRKAGPAYVSKKCL